MIRFLFLAAALGAAQAPVVGDVEFYGLHRVPPDRILSALEVKTGAPLPPSKGGMEDALENVPGILLGRVEAVCCDGSRATLFIGVEERGGAHTEFRPAPAGEAALPPGLVDSYQEFLEAVARAAGRQNAAEDLTAGHSMMADPAARAFQVKFQDFAAANVPLLREVLRNAAEPGQRAIAAAVIGYAPRKKEAVDDLEYALQDPDETVRSNAIRSLEAIAVLASRQPALAIRIPATWLIELLNSLVLSDRVEAVNALLMLTDGGDRELLGQIRERGAEPLEEMARWKTPRYALPPFMLLGRTAGIPDAELQKAWERADRESVLRKVAGKERKRG